ncbi:GIY-YIG nuclease family protein [Halorubrum trueperi]|uniref:GIY-YIG nuclease family protein n=1 Tax=Halorubrum trueperi TaxID=2004704 RepID=A0ABD5UN70_9EURY
MRLPVKNPNTKEVKQRIKEFVEKSHPGDEKSDSVYVLECNKAKSKESTIEAAKELLEEYPNDDEKLYLDPIKERRDNRTSSTSRPNSFEEALDTETKNMKYDPYISYPAWIEYCYNAEDIYYVGWSNKVEERITKHVVNNGSLFTKIFSPIKIEEIRWYPSKADAKKAEGSVAGEYSDIGPDTDLQEDSIGKYAYFF